MIKEYEIELAAVQAIEEECNEHLNVMNKAFSDIALIKEKGVTRGFMLALEAAKGDDEAPLEVPIGMFTTNPSMSGLNIAVESLKEKAAEAFRSFVGATKKLFKTIMDFILRTLNSIKFAVMGRGKDEEVSKEAVLAKLNELAKGSGLSGWLSSETPNVNLCQEVIKKLIADFKSFDEQKLNFIDSFKELIDINTLNEIAIGGKDAEGIDLSSHASVVTLGHIKETYTSDTPVDGQSAYYRYVASLNNTKLSNLNVSNVHFMLRHLTESKVRKIDKELEVTNYEPHHYADSFKSLKESVDIMTNLHGDKGTSKKEYDMLDDVAKLKQMASKLSNEFNTTEVYSGKLTLVCKDYVSASRHMGTSLMHSVMLVRLVSGAITDIYNAYNVHAPEKN